MCVLVPWILPNPNFFYLLMGHNQCEAKVVVKENLVATTNNELEKITNDKMEMTYDCSDVEKVE